MTNTPQEDEELHRILAPITGDRITAGEVRNAVRLIKAHSEKVALEAKIEVLRRVKGMGVYDVDRPNDLFVWSWKLDREISELQLQLNNQDKEALRVSRNYERRCCTY